MKFVSFSLVINTITKMTSCHDVIKFSLECQKSWSYCRVLVLRKVCLISETCLRIMKTQCCYLNSIVFHAAAGITSSWCAQIHHAKTRSPCSRVNVSFLYLFIFLEHQERNKVSWFNLETVHLSRE